MDAKSWFASKTFWVAIVTGIASVTGGLITDTEQASIVGGIMAVVMIVLRKLTSKPIG